MMDSPNLDAHGSFDRSSLEFMENKKNRKSTQKDR